MSVRPGATIQVGSVSAGSSSLRSLGQGPVSPLAATALAALPFGAVRLQGGLLGRLQHANGSTSIPRGIAHLEDEQAWTNYETAALGRRDVVYHGPFFEDGEAYKFLEAAAWEAGRSGAEDLVGYLARRTQQIGSAQEADGYLNTFIQCGQRGERFGRLDLDHEIFNVGALVQSGVAQFRSTGRAELLDIACRAADQLDATFGPNQRAGTCGHPLSEMALVELYRTTQEPRYLRLASYFVDVRGRGVLSHPEGPTPTYLSDRVPVRETETPEGHAVRAVYLAAGATDVAIETGDTALLEQLQLQWQNMVSSKMYVTGGLGSRWDGEAFGDPFELPSDRAYAETCAAIAGAQWSWRLLLATGEAKYADLIERQLYNAVLPGVSLDGDSYFYVNALQVRGGAVADDSRSPVGGRRHWFGCSCCPTNLMRTLASLHTYVATTTSSGLQIHQLASGEITADLDGGAARVVVDTDYPWDGRVGVTVTDGPAQEWVLSVRVPAWATGATARVADDEVPVVPGEYLRVRRVWRAGTTLELNLPVEPRFVQGDPRVDSSRGCVAVERGPLVYAFEQVDNPTSDIDDLVIDADVPLQAQLDSEVLGGAWVVDARTPIGPTGQPGQGVRAVPYFMWANRQVGPMRVWVPAVHRG